MPFNYARAQMVAHRQITRFGKAAGTSFLRRGDPAVNRAVTCAYLSWENSQRQSGLVQDKDKRVIMSAYQLTVPPDQELDTMLLDGVEYAIVEPPLPLDQSGIVVYWELHVRPRQ